MYPGLVVNNPRVKLEAKTYRLSWQIRGTRCWFSLQLHAIRSRNTWTIFLELVTKPHPRPLQVKKDCYYSLQLLLVYEF